MKEETKPTETRGRPPVDSPRDGIVRMRVELSEKGEWVRAARKAGKTLSQWLRDLANRHV